VVDKDEARQDRGGAPVPPMLGIIDRLISTHVGVRVTATSAISP